MALLRNNHRFSGGLCSEIANPVDDIHHELDRAAAEGLPEGHEDARRNAQRGVRHPAHGKDGHGQEVIPEAGAQNRS